MAASWMASCSLHKMFLNTCTRKRWWQVERVRTKVIYVCVCVVVHCGERMSKIICHARSTPSKFKTSRHLWRVNSNTHSTPHTHAFNYHLMYIYRENALICIMYICACGIFTMDAPTYAPKCHSSFRFHQLNWAEMEEDVEKRKKNRYLYCT